jgi:hypothetical protein
LGVALMVAARRELQTEGSPQFFIYQLVSEKNLKNFPKPLAIIPQMW